MSLNNLKYLKSKKFNQCINNIEHLQEIHNNFQSSADENSPEDLVTKWLAQLNLLYGVPFRYLVPSEAMLPIESIKFFYIDNNWLTALVDGAYSLGRISVSDNAHDTIFKSKIDKNLKLKAHQIRRKALGKINDNSSSDVITGFLLRSEAVASYTGMEIAGYSAAIDTNNPDANKLKIIRMDHLSSSILICLFAGEVNYLQINTPTEAIHSGFDPSGDTNFIKTLRNADGMQSTTQIAIDQTYYRSANSTVVNMTKLADSMNSTLKLSVFTSAEFGLQMTVGIDSILLNKQS